MVAYEAFAAQLGIPQDWINFFQGYVRELNDWAPIAEFINAGANAAALYTLFNYPWLAQPIISSFNLAKDFVLSGHSKIQADALAKAVPARPQQTVGIQAPFINNESNLEFAGFSPNNHVVIIGSTSSGKTTNTITMLLKQKMFTQFDVFVYTASSLSENKISQVRQAVMCNLELNQNKTNTNNTFVYYKETQVTDSVNFLSTQHRDKNKLAFFDDMQIAAERDLNKIAGFIHQAKNAQVQMVVSLHRAFGSKDEIKLREACRYYVLYNANEDVFNRLLGLKTGNPLYKKYSLIEEKYDRVLIYDKEERKSYYGTHRYLAFDPLIERGNDNQKQTQQSQQTVVY